MGGGGTGSLARVMPEPTRGTPNGGHQKRCGYNSHFQMPLHYPRYKKSDYENMPEWKLDCLLTEYGLPVTGDVQNKRNFAMGAFLWTSD
ncbi:hypothetical protein QJS04_geneDACA011108 [Acorus gramineus]|uniref:DUF7722 domain-containing protein n=1 Tax=Acorus gramineus TaxID=55184 RepID=A0AAV9BGI8_ACOGR|nr:hypothetical protein QJS04_geneDACA011108 [Acorus gramineus]